MELSRLAFALALSTALVSPVMPAFAGSVEALAPVQGPAVYPGAETGQFRTWVQLVWNGKSRKLDRLSFTAWDPIPSLGLELSWQPDDPDGNRAGPLEGNGTLSFRKPGAAAYDASATLAQYRGSFTAGRPDGTGEFLDRSGFAYVGEWRDGVMEGSGRVTLANGDEYMGSFRAGRREGEGLFTDAAGEIYEGGFAADRRDGQGILVPSAGEAYAADWANGVEVPGSRHAVPPGMLPVARLATAQAPEVPGLRLGVVAERRPHNFELDMDPLSYTSKSDGQTLEILPDDQRLLDVWHGVVPITVNDAESVALNNNATTPSFLGPFERFDPLSLVFELENSSTETVAVVGGFLDVADSVRDLEPAVQVRPYPRQPCGGGIDFMPKFNIDNLGWGAADNAKLTMTIGSGDGRPAGPQFDVPLQSIMGTVQPDVANELAALGLHTDVVSTTKLHCTDPNDQRLCINELKQSGHFGQLGDYLSLDYTTVTVSVMGSLDYDWTATDGAVAHKSSQFALALPIASVATDAECGEGGEIMPVRRDPFVLHLDEKGYKIALPFAADVTPGFTARWRIELSATQTSLHDFHIVLLLADGRQVSSRPVHLTYFMPQKLVPVQDGG